MDHKQVYALTHYHIIIMDANVYFCITFHCGNKSIQVPTYVYIFSVCVRVRRHIRSYGEIDRRETTYVDVQWKRTYIYINIVRVFGDRSSFARCKPPPPLPQLVPHRKPIPGRKGVRGILYRYFWQFFSPRPRYIPRHGAQTQFTCTHIFIILLYKCHNNNNNIRVADAGAAAVCHACDLYIGTIWLTRARRCSSSIQL